MKKTTDLIYISLSAALMAVCAQVCVPSAVPFTLQTFAVFTVAGLLGAKRALLSIAVYMLLGIAGLPVFSGFRNGAGVLLSSTGGYIIGFLFIALIVGAVSDRFGRKPLPLAMSMTAGLAVCYIFGTAWCALIYADGESFGALLKICVAPFVLPDICKICLAAFAVKRIYHAIKI